MGLITHPHTSYNQSNWDITDSIPPLHRNELLVFHNAIQPHYYTENMPSKINLNSLVLSKSYDAQLSAGM